MCTMMLKPLTLEPVWIEGVCGCHNIGDDVDDLVARDRALDRIEKADETPVPVGAACRGRWAVSSRTSRRLGSLGSGELGQLEKQT